MPETFPNVSISDLTREVDERVDALHAKIAELEDAIKAEYERVRQTFGASIDSASVAPPEAESAPVSTDASTEPEPVAPADPPAATVAVEPASEPAPGPVSTTDVEVPPPVV